jgi:hypothetical protein
VFGPFGVGRNRLGQVRAHCRDRRREFTEFGKPVGGPIGKQQ